MAPHAAPGRALGTGTHTGWAGLGAQRLGEPGRGAGRAQKPRRCPLNCRCRSEGADRHRARWRQCRPRASTRSRPEPECRQQSEALGDGVGKVSVEGGDSGPSTVRGPSCPCPQTAKGPSPEEETRAGVQQAPPGNPRGPRRQPQMWVRRGRGIRPSPSVSGDPAGRAHTPQSSPRAGPQPHTWPCWHPGHPGQGQHPLPRYAQTGTLK